MFIEQIFFTFFFLKSIYFQIHLRTKSSLMPYAHTWGYTRSSKLKKELSKGSTWIHILHDITLNICPKIFFGTVYRDTLGELSTFKLCPRGSFSSYIVHFSNPMPRTGWRHVPSFRRTLALDPKRATRDRVTKLNDLSPKKRGPATIIHTRPVVAWSPSLQLN